MRYSLGSIVFEIPDEVWKAAGMPGFTPHSEAYAADSPNLIVSIEKIEPPLRKGGVVWFRCDDDLRRVLYGFRTGDALPPIDVDEPPNAIRYQYRVRDGLHRFYAAVAVGYRCLPVRVLPYFNMTDL